MTSCASCTTMASSSPTSSALHVARSTALLLSSTFCSCPSRTRRCAATGAGPKRHDLTASPVAVEAQQAPGTSTSTETLDTVAVVDLSTLDRDHAEEGCVELN